MSVPRCTTCGYDLTELALDGLCPECGAPIPPRPLDAHARAEAFEAMQLGLTALLGSFTCLGPFAAIIAWMSLERARSVRGAVREGAASPDAARDIGLTIAASAVAIAIAVLELFFLLLMAT